MDHEFWNDLLLMRRQYARLLEDVSRKWQLTRAEMEVLLFLAANPCLDRATDIVELRGLTKSHVSIAVKELYDRGMVVAEQDENDRRVIHLKTTPAAADAIAAGQEVLRTHFDKMYGCFSEEELQQWLALQKKLFANMKNLEE